MNIIEELKKEVQAMLEESEAWRMEETPPTREQVFYLRILEAKKAHLVREEDIWNKIVYLKAIDKLRWMSEEELIEELFGEDLK